MVFLSEIRMFMSNQYNLKSISTLFSGNRPTANILAFFAVAICMLLISSCANMGSPSGGPRDEEPPRFVSSEPAMGATNVSKNKITLSFNELVNVKDAFSKVVVSPTSKVTPRVSSLGRRVTIDFDSLRPNTTYTVDFADAIEDNNEANKLQGFAYTFSTGEQLDSLRISGRVLSARALEPQQSMIVGVHANLCDTAFTGIPLLRVAKTDDRGQFTIRGLAPGKYRIFALGDNDNDYKYSSPEEDIAFHDFTIEPYCQSVVAYDTVFNRLTGLVDTVTQRLRTQFLPNDILLRSFNSELRQQYLTEYQRVDSTRVFLKFNTRADSLPNIRIIGKPDNFSLGTLEASTKLDSLVWWLPKELVSEDSLKLAVTYTRSNPDLSTQLVTDTLDFFTRKLKAKSDNKKKKRRISEADSIAAITTKFEAKSASQQEYNLPVLFECPAPLAHFDTTAIHLSVKVDSTYQEIKSGIKFSQPDSLSPRKFELAYPWEYGTSYRLEIDSLAATDIYGLPTLPFLHDFTVKKSEDYCSLLFHITDLDSIPAFVELLDNSDAVKRTAIVSNGDAFFPFLTPGRYFARVILDTNGNGIYDTGNYEKGIQPELAYYYPKTINVKKNWDKEENWALFDTPVDMMKPYAVLKNRPATDKRNRNNKNNQQSDEEEEEDGYFDPTRNPFDPNYKDRRKTTVGSY